MARRKSISYESKETVTARERQIIALAALGYSNEEIGVILYISRETVKSYIHHALMKLRAHNRAELVYRAIQGGVLLVTSSQDRQLSLGRRSTMTSVEGWNGEPEELLRILLRE